MHALIGLIFAASLAGGQPPDSNGSVTVDQLKTLLVDASHEPDTKIAHRIVALHLTERLTASGLEKIDDALQPGPETREVLRLLADSSAFLDPPEAEIPARAAPSIAEQQTVINGAEHFVAVTERQLPDFGATRTTYSFDDRPTPLLLKGWAQPGSMHDDGIFSAGDRISQRTRGGWSSTGQGFAGRESRGSVGADFNGRVWHVAGRDAARHGAREAGVESLGNDGCGGGGRFSIRRSGSRSRTTCRLLLRAEV